MKIFQRFRKKDGKQNSSLIVDATYYKNIYEDIKLAGIDPRIHFFEYGWKEKRNPSFLFDTHFYIKSQNLKEDVNPLDHYLSNSKNSGVNPHPDFDTEYYLSQVGDVDISPLDHFYSEGIDLKIKPNPNFSFAMIEKRKDGLQTYSPDENLDSGNGFKDELEKLDREIPVIICVSHEASRTGAPLIILNIAKYLKEDYAIQVINIIGSGGSLNEDFWNVGPTLILQFYKEYSGNKAIEEIEYYIDLIKCKELNIIGAFVNSAESRRMLQPMSILDIPIYSLVHEMGHLYPDREFGRIFEYSDMVIFPCNIVKESAAKNIDLVDQKVFVRGQGLLKPELLKDHKEAARSWLREKYNIPSNGFIVLGCGSMVLRKGYDLFVKTAIEVVKNDASGLIYFMWLGGEHEGIKQDYSWTYLDIEKTDSSSRILFVGEHDDTTYFFAGSDLFFLSSREDPFPCVLHEAMATKLPIVSYRKSGGAEELIEEYKIGELIDYASINSGVEAILNIYNDKIKYVDYATNAYITVVDEFNYSSYVDFLMDNLLQNFYDLDEIKSFGLGIPLESFKQPSKRIIFTLPGWGLSGVNTFIELLIKYLNRTGYEAMLLFTVSKESIQDYSLIPDVPHHFLNVDPYNYAERWKQLEEFLLASSPCVFVPNYDYVASAISPKLPNEIGILGVLHSDDMEHYEHAYRLGAYWNKIVCVSQEIEKKLNAFNASFSDKISLIHYGIEDTPSLNLERNEIFTIIYSGRISTFQKRILEYHSIIKLLKSKAQIPFKFKFFGDGPQMNEFMQIMQSFVDEGIVEIHGRVDRKKVFEELSKAHMFSLVSEFEGLPLSLLEAMHFGCVPILFSIESGVEEIIKDSNNGFIIPRDQDEKYVDAILTLMKNREQLLNFSNRAKKAVSSGRFYEEDMGEKYLKLINQILFEIKTKKYKRPKMLTHNPGLDGILLPPNLQKL